MLAENARFVALGRCGERARNATEVVDVGVLALCGGDGAEVEGVESGGEAGDCEDVGFFEGEEGAERVMGDSEGC